MDNAASKSCGRPPDSLDRTDEIVHQLLDIVAATIGQFGLGERPNSLIRVEIRRVGREMLDVQPGLLDPELLQRVPLVGLGVIEEHNDRAA